MQERSAENCFGARESLNRFEPKWSHTLRPRESDALANPVENAMGGDDAQAVKSQGPTQFPTGHTWQLPSGQAGEEELRGPIEVAIDPLPFVRERRDHD